MANSTESVVCTAPWHDLFVVWDRVSVCCPLTTCATGQCAVTKPWEAWDDFDGVVLNSPILQRLREDMRTKQLDLVCNQQTVCTSRKVRASVDTTGNGFFPHSATIYTTSRCQARCHYCGYHKPGRLPNPTEPSLAQVKRLVAKLKQLRFDHIWYSGGDTLFLPDDKLDTYMSVLDVGTSVHVVTNAIGLTKPRWDRWFRNPNAYLQITLDCVDPATYACTRGQTGAWTIHDNLRRIFSQEDLSRIQIAATITLGNIDHFSELMWFAKEVGLSEVSLNPVSGGTPLPNGWNCFGADATLETCAHVEQRLVEWQALEKTTGIKLAYLERYQRTMAATKARVLGKCTSENG